MQYEINGRILDLVPVSHGNTFHAFRFRESGKWLMIDLGRVTAVDRIADAWWFYGSDISKSFLETYNICIVEEQFNDWDDHQ